MQNEEFEQNPEYTNYYKFARTQLIDLKQSTEETKRVLMRRSVSEEMSDYIIAQIEPTIKTAKRETSNNRSKNLIIGVLWCIVGISATILSTQYIFYGAIVYGVIRIFKGLFSDDD